MPAVHELSNRNHLTKPSETIHDVLVIGAGPTGLACAIDAQNEELDVLVVDKGCLTNSLFHYPAGMTFFTTPELLEIGGMPFSFAKPEAHAGRSAGVLPQGEHPLPPGRAAVRAGG